MKVLVLNCGSSSVKWTILETDTGARLREGTVERIGTSLTHAQAIAGVLAEAGPHGVEAVGHRVVHGGARFDAPVVITDDVVDAIEACVPLAPLPRWQVTSRSRPSGVFRCSAARCATYACDGPWNP